MPSTDAVDTMPSTDAVDTMGSTFVAAHRPRG
jgi:hypothetical protein